VTDDTETDRGKLEGDEAGAKIVDTEVRTANLERRTPHVAWEDVGAGGGGGGSAAVTPAFALSGPSYFPTDGPEILDNLNGGPGHFSTTDIATFDATTGGRARILVPGFYVIGLHFYWNNSGPTGDVWVDMLLTYEGDIGASIEIPYAESGFRGGVFEGEFIFGTRYVVPSGESSLNFATQRLHPISLTTTTTFPLEIQPKANAYDFAHVSIQWMSVWGWRLSDPLDAYHSD